jgi:hypothetical protein
MFAKVFEQIFNSSIAVDYTVRHMFMDMLVLADSQGVVDMTYEAIARRTGVPLDKVIASIGELMKPDAQSRSRKEDGARIALVDSHRDWGFRIVNYPHYRNLRDEEGRRAYSRDYMRTYMRTQREQQRLSKQKSNNGLLDKKDTKSNEAATVRQKSPPVKPTESNKLNSSSVDVRPPLNTLDSVRPRLTHAEGEGDIRLSAVSQNREAEAEERVTDPIEAKRLICEKILNGKNPGRMFSPDAENRLAAMCKDEGGIPRREIEDIAWFQPFRRETLTETSLMLYWGDEAKRAADARRKFGGGCGATKSEKAEPQEWREFFKWKNDNPDITLPASFWQLTKERRAEYERDFQTFVNRIEETK